MTLPRCAVAALAALALPLAGCVTVGPDYARPELAVPTAYPEAAAAGSADAAAVPDAWWTLFDDPHLDALVAEALVANADLLAAAARVEEARAFAGLARAERLPEVLGSAGGARTRISPETSGLPAGTDPELDRVSATASLAWEIDFWGRLRRLSEAARAELLASAEGQRAIRLAVAAEVASAYFDLVALDRQLAVASETAGSRSESVRLLDLRFRAGTISELELAQSQAEFGAAEAAVPALQRALRLTENRLQVLLGRIGGSAGPRAALAEVTVPEVPVGLPSELLARRPDVVAAEQRLVAANARIGATRALYFPTIALTGAAGSESAELSGLFGSGTSVWQAALNLVGPIFDAGRTRRRVEIAEARRRQSEAEYAGTVQTAFAEVADALATRSTAAAERAALEREVEALVRARRLSGIRFDAGESSFFEVLDADRSLFRAQLDLARVRRIELDAVVALVRALGGGWSMAAAEPAGDGATDAAGR